MAKKPTNNQTGNIVSLKELLGLEDETTTAPALPHIKQIAALAEAAKLYERMKNGVPFKAQQLVTPRKNSIYDDAGIPHMVMETRKPKDAEPKPSSASLGRPMSGGHLDVRLARITTDGKRVVLFWAESFAFEEYKPLSEKDGEQTAH